MAPPVVRAAPARPPGRGNALSTHPDTAERFCMRFSRKSVGRGPSSSAARPSLEELEMRLAPYAASGNAWPEPQLITVSFVPDGTLMTSGTNGNVYSDMFAKFNAKWP